MKITRIMAFILAGAIPASAGPAIRKDHQAHVLVGLGVGFTGAYVAEKLGSSHPWAWGLGLGVAAGVGKELVDRRRSGHSAEFSDALATSLGAGAGVTIQLRFTWR